MAASVGVTADTEVAERLATELPDAPRWIETRAMLRSGHATVAGGATVFGGFVVRLLHGAVSVVSVVGEPGADAILAAVDGITAMTPIIAQTDNVDYVERTLRDAADSPHGREWHRERVIVHHLTSSPPLPPLEATASIHLLTTDDPLDHLPPGLRFEMTHARTMTPVGAVFVGGIPVSFCYACWTTESLWDVSIDTLAPWSGRGLAGHVVRFMIDDMHRNGRAPVWAALESNRVSLRLAARLGFAPVAETFALSREPWAYLTNGYV
jgi:RimJ/RimL family protein N-acetyltransferase